MVSERPDKESAEGKPGVAALDRGIAILNAFDDKKPVLTLAELADRTGIYKSTILRLSQSLIRGGLLARNEDGRYRIGSAALGYGALFQAGLDLGDVLKPLMARLTEETSESTIFYIREGDRRICWHRVDAQQAVRYNIRIGDVLPLDRGSGGRVVSAFTGGTGLDHEQIRAQLFWIAMGERNAEIAGISAPVFGAEQRFIGALSLAGPQTRMFRDRLVDLLPLLMECAASATRALGGDPAPLLEARARVSRNRDRAGSLLDMRNAHLIT